MSWESEDAYEYMNDHTVREWGWEFIRRDERYIKEWEYALEKYLKTPPQHRLLEILIAPNLSQYSRGILSSTIQLGYPDEIDSFVLLGNGAVKWGLNFYQSPVSKKLNSANYAVKLFHNGYFDEENPLDEVSVAADEHILVPVIDFKKPIKPQIEEISKCALNLQDKLKKELLSKVHLKAETATEYNKSVWRKYLRLIDAEKSCVDVNQAALILFSGAAQGADNKWRETKKQIQAIAAENYRLLMD